MRQGLNFGVSQNRNSRKSGPLKKRFLKGLSPASKQENPSAAIQASKHRGRRGGNQRLSPAGLSAALFFIMALASGAAAMESRSGLSGRPFSPKQSGALTAIEKAAAEAASQAARADSRRGGMQNSLSLSEKSESGGAGSRLAAKIFFSEKIPAESRARAAAAFEKLSQNQSRFAEAVSRLRFEFSPEAAANLKARFERLSDLEKAQNLEAGLRRMRSELQSLGDPEAVFALDFSRAFAEGLPEAESHANPYARAPRAWKNIDVSLEWKDFPGADRAAADILGPSPKKWFEARARDWALLGREIINNFPSNGEEPGLEAFDQLISRSIDKLAAESLSQGRLFWLSADFAASSYSRFARQFQKGDIPMVLYSDLYSDRLKTEAFRILLSQPLEYKLFSLELPSKAREKIRRGYGVHLKAGKNIYFPFLETGLLAKGRLRQIRAEGMQLLEAAEIIKGEGLNLADKGLFALRSEAAPERVSGSQMHIPPADEHKALRRLFISCRESPLLAQNPDIEWLGPPRRRPGELYIYSRWSPSKGFRRGFPAFLSDPPFADEHGRPHSLWGLSPEKSIENAFFEGGNGNHSFYQKGVTPFCAAVMAVFRQIYLQNALSLYKKYLTGLSGGPSSSGAYRDWERLRGEELALREELAAAKSRKAEKEAALLAEKEKDSRFLALVFKKHTGWTGWGADPEKSQALEREIQNEEADIKQLLEKKLLAEEKTLPYRERFAVAFLAPYEDLAADLEFSKSRSKETAGRLAFMEREIFRREREARSSIGGIERLLPRYQKEYLEARDFLASFSFEEARSKARAEWSAALRVFFEGLAWQSQEHEEKSNRKARLSASIEAAEKQLAVLEARLGGLAEAGESPKPLERAYLELKLGIISSLTGPQGAPGASGGSRRAPRLEEVWAALLLRHYQEAGSASLKSFAQFLSLLDHISEAPAAPLISFKEAYEKNIADWRGAPLLYNRDFRSLAHPLLAGRVQCYSGTMLFYAMTELGGLRFRPRFALFADGHILPGILRGPEGEKRLYGIETTVQGKGLFDFGAASEVSGEIRVVEMYPFLLIELLKSEISGFPELFSSLRESLRQYGFSPERHLPLNDLQADGSEEDSMAGLPDDILNATPFGFGRSSMPSGDRLRSQASLQALSAFYDLSGSGSSKPLFDGPSGRDISAGSRGGFPDSLETFGFAAGNISAGSRSGFPDSLETYSFAAGFDDDSSVSSCPEDPEPDMSDNLLLRLLYSSRLVDKDKARREGAALNSLLSGLDAGPDLPGQPNLVFSRIPFFRGEYDFSLYFSHDPQWICPVFYQEYNVICALKPAAAGAPYLNNDNMKFPLLSPAGRERLQDMSRYFRQSVSGCWLKGRAPFSRASSLCCPRSGKEGGAKAPGFRRKAGQN